MTASDGSANVPNIRPFVPTLPRLPRGSLRHVLAWAESPLIPVRCRGITPVELSGTSGQIMGTFADPSEEDTQTSSFATIDSGERAQWEALSASTQRGGYKSLVYQLRGSVQALEGV